MSNEENAKEFAKGNNNKNQAGGSLVLNIVSMLIIGALIVIANYFLFNSFADRIIAKVNTEPVEAEEEVTDEIERGIIVDLGDFILNLADDSARKYLKVNVAVEVSKKESDTPQQTEQSSGGHGGHGSAPAPVDPMEAIQKEMNQFKPAIRDAVITNLTSKTSTELSTTAGKELAKEQIADEINSIFGGEREVLRVSFGQFIIQ